MAAKKKPVDLIGVLEQEIMNALENKIGKKPLTMREKIALITAGTRLAAARHKIDGPKEEEGFFK